MHSGNNTEEGSSIFDEKVLTCKSYQMIFYVETFISMNIFIHFIPISGNFFEVTDQVLMTTFQVRS